jgi:hypothetical protein
VDGCPDASGKNQATFFPAIPYRQPFFPLVLIHEIKAAKEHNQKSVLQIISDAIDLEKKEDQAYADLAFK